MLPTALDSVECVFKIIMYSNFPEVPVTGMDLDQPSAYANGTPQLQERTISQRLSIYSYLILALEIVLISAISIESPIEPVDEDSTRRQSSQEGTTMNIIRHSIVVYSFATTYTFKIKFQDLNSKIWMMNSKACTMNSCLKFIDQEG